MKKDSLLSRIAAAMSPAEGQLKLVADLENLQAEFEAFKAEANALLEAAEAQVQEMTQALQDKTEQVEALQAEVSQLKTSAEALMKTAEEKRLAARKEKIVAAIGTGQADALMAATTSMEDAQFEAVLAALAGKQETESKSKMFTEQGVAAEVDAATYVEETPEMKALRGKYQNGSK